MIYLVGGILGGNLFVGGNFGGILGGRLGILVGNLGGGWVYVIGWVVIVLGVFICYCWVF